jgi:hypothetical protein
MNKPFSDMFYYTGKGQYCYFSFQTIFWNVWSLIKNVIKKKHVFHKNFPHDLRSLLKSIEIWWKFCNFRWLTKILREHQCIFFSRSSLDSTYLWNFHPTIIQRSQLVRNLNDSFYEFSYSSRRTKEKYPYAKGEIPRTLQDEGLIFLIFV